MNDDVPTWLYVGATATTHERASPIFRCISLNYIYNNNETTYTYKLFVGALRQVFSRFRIVRLRDIRVV